MIVCKDLRVRIRWGCLYIHTEIKKWISDLYCIHRNLTLSQYQILTEWVSQWMRGSTLRAVHKKVYCRFEILSSNELKILPVFSVEGSFFSVNIHKSWRSSVFIQRQQYILYSISNRSQSISCVHRSARRKRWIPVEAASLSNDPYIKAGWL